MVGLVLLDPMGFSTLQSTCTLSSTRRRRRRRRRRQKRGLTSHDRLQTSWLERRGPLPDQGSTAALRPRPPARLLDERAYSSVLQNPEAEVEATTTATVCSLQSRMGCPPMSRPPRWHCQPKQIKTESPTQKSAA